MKGMIRMKKFISVMLAVAIAVCSVMTVSCKKIEKEEQTEPQKTEEVSEPEKTEETQLSGGWTIPEYSESASIALEDEVKEAYESAVDAEQFRAVAYLGSQVVAGVNYAFLCLDKTDNSFKELVIYKNLEGKSEITNVRDVSVSDYTGGESDLGKAFSLAGGWFVDDANGIGVGEDILGFFANEYIIEDDIAKDPIALLGTQVVAGTNYAVLCKVAEYVLDSRMYQGLAVAIVYKDLEGKMDVISWKSFNINESNVEELVDIQYEVPYEDDFPVLGGWTLVSEEEIEDDLIENKDFGKKFDALEDSGELDRVLNPGKLDYEYELMAGLGYKVEANKEYTAYLCLVSDDKTDKSLFYAVIISTVTESADRYEITYSRIIEGIKTASEGTENMSLWNTELAEGTPLPKDAQEAFDKAMEGFVGANYKPLALLGRQVVAGVNYAVLCSQTVITDEPFDNLAVISIYKDLEGNSEINEINGFSIEG